MPNFDPSRFPWFVTLSSIRGLQLSNSNDIYKNSAKQRVYHDRIIPGSIERFLVPSIALNLAQTFIRLTRFFRWSFVILRNRGGRKGKIRSLPPSGAFIRPPPPLSHREIGYFCLLNRYTHADRIDRSLVSRIQRLLMRSVGTICWTSRSFPYGDNNVALV